MPAAVDGQIADTGFEFEKRALALARAIYDPSGQQGPAMINGRERDAVFIDSRSVVAFEFTAMRTRDKAEKDGEKLRGLLKHFSTTADHKYKTLQAFFLTMEEPTADQRDAIALTARKSGFNIAAISYLTLRRLLVDTENYLALRRQAPFGSTAYQLPAGPASISSKYVNPIFAPSPRGKEADIDDIFSLLSSGYRVVVTGDFGAGKSEALLQLFERGRKAYFKKADVARFPLHINLRDCYGLRTPTEILRRHSEEIGFSDDRSLVAAWRAGACDLLLDGFDELVPSRWVGGARDLRQVRWGALDPVRRLVLETPDTCGLVISGRAQYFADEDELRRCVGISDGVTFSIIDFDSQRVNSYLGASSPLPEWVPTRPLLLKFLAQNDLIAGLDIELQAPNAWLKMLDAIASRESDRISSVTPERTLALIARIATTSRSNESGAGSITTEEMRTVFREVCGYEADEEGLQLLLRLPGLTSAESPSGSESRRFVDQALADAAYGFDLAQYISAPYINHPLSGGVSWVQAATELSWQVASTFLDAQSFEPGIVIGPIQDRLDRNNFDAVLFDCVQTGIAAGTKLPPELAPFFSGVLIGNLVLNGQSMRLESAATYKDCVIEILDVSNVEDSDSIPTFQDCLIERIDGWSAIPPGFSSNFETAEVGTLSAHSSTTAGLAALTIPAIDRVALVVLRKVYAQAGSGRKASALARGLPLADRALVQESVTRLISLGYLASAAGKTESLVIPIRDRRSRVLEILGSPNGFRLESLV